MSKLRCESCGYIVQPIDRFCLKCGAPLRSANTITTEIINSASPKQKQSLRSTPHQQETQVTEHLQASIKMSGLSKTKAHSPKIAWPIIVFGVLLIGAAVTINALLSDSSAEQTPAMIAATWTATPMPITTSTPASEVATEYKYLIIFISNRDGNYEIYEMWEDGSTQINISNDPADDMVLSLSPDESKIVAESTSSGNSEVIIENADESGQVNLTNNTATDMAPSFSPDGSKIAFTSNRDGNFEIYIMNIDGSEQIRLTNNTADDLAPSFSPDGSAIAFHSNRDGNEEIYIMNIDGSEQVNLTNDPAFDVDPSFSPDGSKIAFASDRDGNEEIYIMNINGSERVRLTNNPAVDTAPFFTIPGGPKIVNLSVSDGSSQIYFITTQVIYR